MKVLGLDDRIPASESGMDIGVPLTPEQVTIVSDEIPKIFETATRDEWVSRLLDAEGIAHLGAIERDDGDVVALSYFSPSMGIDRSPYGIGMRELLHSRPDGRLRQTDPSWIPAQMTWM